MGIPDLHGLHPSTLLLSGQLHHFFSYCSLAFSVIPRKWPLLPSVCGQSAGGRGTRSIVQTRPFLLPFSLSEGEGAVLKQRGGWAGSQEGPLYSTPACPSQEDTHTYPSQRTNITHTTLSARLSLIHSISKMPGPNTIYFCREKQQRVTVCAEETQSPDTLAPARRDEGASGQSHCHPSREVLILGQENLVPTPVGYMGLVPMSESFLSHFGKICWHRSSQMGQNTDPENTN